MSFSLWKILNRGLITVTQSTANKNPDKLLTCKSTNIKVYSATFLFIFIIKSILF